MYYLRDWTDLMMYHYRCRSHAHTDYMHMMGFLVSHSPVHTLAPPTPLKK